MRNPARPGRAHLRPRGSPKPRPIDADAVRRRRVASITDALCCEAVRSCEAGRSYSGRAHRRSVGRAIECVSELEKENRMWAQAAGLGAGRGWRNLAIEITVVVVVVVSVVEVRCILGDRRRSAKRVTLEDLFGSRDNDQVREQPAAVEGMTCAVTRRHGRRRRRRVVTAIVVLFRVDRVGHDRLGRPAALGLRPIGSRRDPRRVTGAGRE